MIYKKIILTIASAAVMAAPLAVFADAAPSMTDSGSSASSVSGPVITDSGSSAGSASTPAANAGGSSAGSNSAPALTDGGSSAGSNSAPATNGAGSSAGSSVPSNGSTGGSSVNSSSGGWYSSSSGGSSGPGLVVAAPIVASSTNTCPLISSYMKLGASNNSSDVAKLQAFLKNNEKINVAVTGTFDTQTEAAVIAFQNKYLGDIMGPWSATKASGYVYITTMKKINQLACSQPLTLSASDLAIIDAYKASASAAQTPSAAVSAPASTDTQAPVTTSPVIGSAPVVGPVANTASAANASVMGRFWNFLKSLF